MLAALARPVSRLFGSVALARRRWYASHAGARRRLERPVISVGNLSVGGTGKTPVVAEVTRALLAMGERPAILSRGYKRRRPHDRVLVVSDGRAISTDVAHAGDEPFMLARAVPAAAVLVAARRYLAGRIAETQLGCTVHVLDDGFQHLELERDVDFLVVTGADFASPRPLPSGRLREPLSAAATADAVLVFAGDMVTPADAAGRLRVARSFLLERAIEAPRAFAPSLGALPRTPARSLAGAPCAPLAVNWSDPVFAIAGIANPGRFFDDLRRAGWHLAGTRTFPDHHPFSARDVAAVEQAARRAGATSVLTTEKDMVRIPNPESRIPNPESRIPIPHSQSSIPFFWVPLHVTLDPALMPWLCDRLAAARQARDAAPGTRHQVPGTTHQAPSTKHQAPSTKHQEPA